MKVKNYPEEKKFNPRIKYQQDPGWYIDNDKSNHVYRMGNINTPIWGKIYTTLNEKDFALILDNVRNENVNPLLI